MLLAFRSSATIVNSVFTENSGAYAAINLYESYGHTATLSHCDVWGNHGRTFSSGFNPMDDDGNFSEDPQFLDISPTDSSAWDFHANPASPLIGAGNPLLENPDASRSDIGAYGGPGADQWDLDGDGHPEWWQPGPYDAESYPGLGWDCDDQDPSLRPFVGC